MSKRIHNNRSKRYNLQLLIFRGAPLNKIKKYNYIVAGSLINERIFRERDWKEIRVEVIWKITDSSSQPISVKPVFGKRMGSDFYRKTLPSYMGDGWFLVDYKYAVEISKCKNLNDYRKEDHA